jgi:hypothetical protein
MNWKRVTSYIAALALVFCFAGSAMAAGDAKVQSSFTTGFATPTVPEHQTFVISNYCDFSKLYTNTYSGVTGGDTVQLLVIPAGTMVNRVGIRIASAWSTSGATCNGVTIGDGSDANGWIQSIDFGPSASGVSVSGVTAAIDSTSASYMPAQGAYAWVGKYYSSADTIDATIPVIARTAGLAGAIAGCTDMKIQVWAECYKPNSTYRYNQNPPVK